MGAERRTRWTYEHGADGLREKFHVYSAADWRAVDLLGHINSGWAYPADKRLGATGEFVFVLRPESDEAAYEALREYASVVAWRSPQLSEDIGRELDRIWADNRA